MLKWADVDNLYVINAIKPKRSHCKEGGGGANEVPELYSDITVHGRRLWATLAVWEIPALRESLHLARPAATRSVQLLLISIFAPTNTNDPRPHEPPHPEIAQRARASAHAAQNEGGLRRQCVRRHVKARVPETRARNYPSCGAFSNAQVPPACGRCCVMTSRNKSRREANRTPIESKSQNIAANQSHEHKLHAPLFPGVTTYSGIRSVADRFTSDAPCRACDYLGFSFARAWGACWDLLLPCSMTAICTNFCTTWAPRRLEKRAAILVLAHGRVPPLKLGRLTSSRRASCSNSRRRLRWSKCTASPRGGANGG